MVATLDIRPIEAFEAIEAIVRQGEAPVPNRALDAFGRQIHYLRISLTDRCNLRCVYCMPERMVFRPSAEILTDSELFTVLRAMDALGFDKYRLTGGEPTVRPGLPEIVSEIARLPRTREIAMTTNGLRLGALAEPLKRAGLNRVNISIDTLDAAKYKRITRWGNLKDVLRGIEASEQAGLTPIKLNAVVIRGYNEEDVVDLARLTIDKPWQFRFIEVMPFADVAEFQQNSIVTSGEMMQRIEAACGTLAPENGGALDGEARMYRLPGAQGTVGFISPVSAPFCASCNRVRLTADGMLRLCLLKDGELDLRTPLRAGASHTDLIDMIRAAIWRKPWGHDLAGGVIPMNRIMSEIGG